MKKLFSHIIPLSFLIIAFSSCGSVAPKADYRALAKASIRLGMDIGYADNHRLYIEASEWMGAPYRSGGHSKHGTDCSGLTTQLYRKVYKVKLERSSNQQLKQSKKVLKRNLNEGDLVFFSNQSSSKKVGHVGVYLKDGKFIHASSSKGVMISKLNEPYYEKRWIQGGRMK